MRFSIYPAILLGVLLSACSGTSSDTQTSLFSVDEPFESTFQTSELLRFGTNPEAPVFSFVSDVRVTADGTIIVADQQARAVYAFDGDGTFRGQIGESGRGPGEYEGPPHISLFDNDSLLIYDPVQYRAAIFSASGGEWKYIRDYAPNTKADEQRSLRSIIKIPGLEGFITVETSITMEGGKAEPGKNVYMYRKPDGAVSHRILPDLAPRETSIQMSENAISVIIPPFHRQSLVSFLANGVSVAAPWTENLHIAIYNANGDSIAGFAIPFKNKTLTSADISDAESYSATEFQHKTHPAITEMFVTEDQQIWLNFGMLSADSSYWGVFRPDGSLIGKTKFHREISIKRILRNRIYATDTQRGDTEVVLFETNLH